MAGSHPFTLGDEEKTVEGRFWRLEYWLKEGARNPGSLAIARNYSNALMAKKGRRLYEAVTTHGIAAARLSTAGFGDTRPVADNGTDAGRAKNGRVELHRK